jgi:hypothetical protein
MGPVLERYMLAYLMHRDVFIKKTAAHSLSETGSPEALGALWDAFNYFHKYWNGRQVELALNDEGVALEVELRNAIARGRHWLATEPDLRMIESMCASERCLHESQEDLRAWQPPLRIELGGGSDGIRGTVAQYFNLQTADAVKEKLGQFPKGTQFVLKARDGSVQGTAAEIRRYAAERGLIVVSR